MKMFIAPTSIVARLQTNLNQITMLFTLRHCLTLLVFGLIASAVSNVHADGNKPNILWLSAEDISPHIGCYGDPHACLLYTSPSPRDATLSRMPSSA